MRSFGGLIGVETSRRFRNMKLDMSNDDKIINIKKKANIDDIEETKGINYDTRGSTKSKKIIEDIRKREEHQSSIRSQRFLIKLDNNMRPQETSLAKGPINSNLLNSQSPVIGENSSNNLLRSSTFLRTTITTTTTTTSSSTTSRRSLNNNNNNNKFISSTWTNLPSLTSIILMAMIILAQTLFLIPILNVNCQTCQYQQTLIGSVPSTSNGISNSKAPAVGLIAQPNLIVCPKSSQFNDLPHFVSGTKSPTLERQQKLILRHLNQSFINHLQLNRGSMGSVENGDSMSNIDPLNGLIMDDQLLNEIISPIILNAAYARAKEQIVKRRKLENELVRQGKILFSIYIDSISSISRYPPDILIYHHHHHHHHLNAKD